MEQNKKDERQQNQKLPEDVLNASQEPNSMRDPLQQQLEKSEGQNGPEERRTLDKLRQAYGDDGTPQKP
ncbi:hypothetical protein EPD60_15325 [Flaviaesturariibacter flavus]|uniref:Uncharacterized protein n=1 Tax=Flaviaesturariibacter flavus TaxID=2502780 RepID=A0A4R1B841_9BACT|nr:hypothetical protein [Flaviaesturariibacter flavus]TCJ12635.1 hypothetical protein EPD60_15325 [Flaviaesturariibacter flavus]